MSMQCHEAAAVIALYPVPIPNRFEGLAVECLNQSEQDAVFELARGVLRQKFQRGVTISNPADAESFLVMELADRKNEVFAIMFLDNRHRLISFDVLFQGTIDGATVAPRVCVQRALECNAAAVILAHNHPSGVPTPSQADRAITERLKSAFGLIDVRVLDHLIVGDVSERVCSFAECGYL